MHQFWLEVFNALIFFSKWQNDPRIKFTENDYYNDLNAGTLPQVSFIITEGNVSEHPPQSILLGQQKMAQVTKLLPHAATSVAKAGGGLLPPVTFESSFVHPQNTAANCDANVPEYLY